MNPAERMREVVYHARENREGFAWQVRLPDHCWQCETEEGLWRRELEVDVRGFENAIPIVGGTLGSALFFLLAYSLFGWWMFLLLTLATLAIGAGVLYAKSWTETVTVFVSTCPAHADELRMPDVVTHDNELHVFLPTEKLAAAARAQLRAERLGRDRGLPGAPRGTESDVEPPENEGPRYRSPYGAAPPRPVDLPPIKLADDDEPEPF